ncbi:ATP-dependent helicase [Romboutsia ilealis]|nr:ATP-dependent helicase [Romboutsia ilealis]
MHRVKGLEFDYVFLVESNNDIVPYKKIVDGDIDKISRNEKITNERSLLYVSATRAKKSVFVSSYGTISQFLK